MRALRRLGIVLLALVAVNAAIERVSTCPCEADCWCKRPGLGYFRWVMPVGHHLPLEEVERRGS